MYPLAIFSGHFYETSLEEHEIERDGASGPESALVTSTKPTTGCPPPKKCIKLEAERIAAMVKKHFLAIYGTDP